MKSSPSVARPHESHGPEGNLCHGPGCGSLISKKKRQISQEMERYPMVILYYIRLFNIAMEDDPFVDAKK